ncbi:MFS transporter [Luteimonas terricola]|uniref:MFS transporter n=1 Tax=Luteimonas terricola TaxID=645597 RepID=A0ABQ2EBP1_9GAMM|nr:MFS transporter [Luteimonas terricola]GGK05006.1 MFS transporter [Luteimonas terricola]
MVQGPHPHAAAVPMVRLSSFYFAYYAALGAFTPYWALYLQSRGMGITAISVMMSLWYATRVVAPTTWATLASASPRPIRWLRIGSVLTVASFACFLPQQPEWTLFAVMVAFCFFYNAVMPQFEAITLGHLGADAHRYGTVRVWGSIGFILVTSGFGWLIEHYDAAILPWAMLPLFALMAVSAFANRDAGHVGPRGPAGAGFWKIVRQPPVAAFLVAAFLEQLSFGPYYTFFSVYMHDLGYSTSMLGLMWTVGVVFEVAVFFTISTVFRRWDASWLLLVSMASAVLRWWATALWPENLAVMLVAQATHALSFAAFFAAAMQLLARHFPGRLNGHAQGLFYGFSSGLGGVLGALIAGQLWPFGNGHVAFLAAGAFALAGCVIAWIWVVPRRGRAG